MRKRYLLSFLLLTAFAPAITMAQFTNRGTDFWVGYPPTGGVKVSMRLYLSALSTGDSVTVALANDTWTKKYWVPPNTTLVSDSIPMLSAQLTTEGLYIKKAIHITSKSVPVSAYVHLFGSASSGSTMLLPAKIWGNEHYTLAMTQSYGGGNYSIFHIVANEDSTWVEINPTQATQNGWTTGGGTQPNGSYLVKLNKGDIYLVMASLQTTDLTGSTVRSVPNAQGVTHSIAVFGGSTRTALTSTGCTSSGGDLMMGQAYPTQIWGKKYVTAPFATSSVISTVTTSIFRIIVKDPTTIVKRNGAVLTNLVLNRYYQFESSIPDIITADKPVMVAQYMTGACVGVGDPEMIYLSPTETAIAKTGFYRTNSESITTNYLNLIIPTVGLSSLKIGGVSFSSISSSDAYSYSHPTYPGYTVVVRRWPSAREQVIVESNYAFTGITYGQGNVESYGYNIGAQFDSANLAEVPYNTIQSVLFLDKNKNGVQDNGEPLYNYAKVVTARPGVDTVIRYSSTGMFTTFTDTGSYITTVLPFSPYYSSVPATRNSNFTTYQNKDSFVFAIQSAGSIRDMFAGIVATTAARPGFTASYRIGYGNKGTDTADVQIALAKSNKLTFLSATLAPTSVTADTIKWNVAGVKPADVGSIDVKFTAATPPTLFSNDTLKLNVKISSDKTDQTPADNNFLLKQRVTGSYDPNDKAESHEGQILRSAITAGDALNYVIRFQNTGTDTAFNIVVRDTLDAKLDWSSLKITAASHPYKLLLNDNIATWSFNDVYLVDSNKNESLSHGFISFSINAKNTVNAGDVINNRASIYFDHNLPVLTNTVNTNIITEALPVSLLSFTAAKQDNSNLLKWTIAQQVNFSHFELERSENGKDFTTIATVRLAGDDYSFADVSFRRTVNYYRLKLVDKDGKFGYSPVRKINNQGSIDITAYPNPAKETLYLNIETGKNETLQLQLISIEGKILQTQKLPVNAGSNLRSINIASLQSGAYILRISNSDQETSILKFNKQ